MKLWLTAILAAFRLNVQTDALKPDDSQVTTIKKTNLKSTIFLS